MLPYLPLMAILSGSPVIWSGSRFCLTKFSPSTVTSHRQKSLLGSDIPNSLRVSMTTSRDVVSWKHRN